MRRPQRRTLLAPEGYGRFAAIDRTGCGWCLSRILHLLERDAERIAQFRLTHCKHLAAHAHAAANVLVDGVRGPLRGNGIAGRHG